MTSEQLNKAGRQAATKQILRKQNQKDEARKQKVQEKDVEDDPFIEIKTKQRMQIKPNEPATPLKANDVGESLMRKNNYARIIGEPVSQLMKQENRVYKVGGLDHVTNRISRYITDSSSHFRLEAAKFISDFNATDRNEFDKNKLLLNCKNCFVNIETDKIETDGDSIKSLFQINTDYKPELGQSEKFLKMLQEAAPNYWEMILEHVSCCLSKGYVKPEKCLIFIGEGRNGKSAFFHVLDAVFGGTNISNASMHQLQEDNFIPAALENKMLNLCADLPERALKEIDILKAIITHDPIQVQLKNITSWKTTITAMMIFSCNELPPLPNHASATLRRFSVFPFRQVFGQNETLKDELMTEDEKSRILNTFISYHKKIIQNDRRLLHTQTEAEVVEHWKNNSDSASQFITKHMLPYSPETLEANMISNPTVELVRDVYVEFCGNHGLPPQNNTRFNKQMETEGYKRITGRDGKTTVKKWQNCILKTIEKDAKEEKPESQQKIL